MNATLVGEFDSEVKAKSAIDRLLIAHIARDRINTYPTLSDDAPKEPRSDEKVHGAETPLSNDGPLGHLGALAAKVFHADAPAKRSSESEPTNELTVTSPVFLLIDVAPGSDDVAQLESLLKEAGASRVAQHAQ